MDRRSFWLKSYPLDNKYTFVRLLVGYLSEWGVENDRLVGSLRGGVCLLGKWVQKS